MQVTELLGAARSGDKNAEDQLYALLYPDLRRLAHSRLKRSKPCTLLETTALVNEAYLRLHRAGQLRASDRNGFLAYASKAMRSIVVDLVRSRGSLARASADVASLPLPAPDAGELEILQIDRALEQLRSVSERLVRVVEMRYFCGMTEPEIADALSLTERTVRRDWEKARMVLAAALK